MKTLDPPQKYHYEDVWVPVHLHNGTFEVDEIYE